MGAAEFGRGVALSALGKTGPSIVAFAAAGRARPRPTRRRRASRPTRCSRRDRTAERRTAARSAPSRSTRATRTGSCRYGIASWRPATAPAGVKALRRGLVLLEEPDRADQLIAQHLDPTDP